MAGPLAFVAGLLLPSPDYHELARRFGSQQGRYSSALPSQSAHAATVGLRTSITGRTGSEDWTNQVAAGARSEGGRLRAVTSNGIPRATWPVGMFRPNLPPTLVEGRGTGYVTGAYNKGWILLSQAGRSAWGASAGIASARPDWQRATLLEPTERTPKPREMADAFAAANAGRERLSDMFGD